MLSQAFLDDHSTPNTGYPEMRRENNTILCTPNAILGCPKFYKDLILHQYSLYLYCLELKRFAIVSMPGSNEKCPGFWLSEHFFGGWNVLRILFEVCTFRFPHNSQQVLCEITCPSPAFLFWRHGDTSTHPSGMFMELHQTPV